MELLIGLAAVLWLAVASGVTLECERRFGMAESAARGILWPLSLARAVAVQAWAIVRGE